MVGISVRVDLTLLLLVVHDLFEELLRLRPIAILLEVNVMV